MNEQNGKWVTIHGHRVFIKDKNAEKKKEVADKIFGKKEFTRKDVEKISSYGIEDGFGMGYKLNGIYLLNSSDKPAKWLWVINTKRPRHYLRPFEQEERFQARKNGELIDVESFEDGMKKLIKLANKKGSEKNGK